MPVWELHKWISAFPRLENRETQGTRCQGGRGIYLETHLAPLFS